MGLTFVYLMPTL